MHPIEELYPDASYPYDYRPMLESIGEILLQVDDHDYQGDSRVLYHNPASLSDLHSIVGSSDEYGILIFGWGSCSGCDSLQSCTSHAEIEELRTSLMQGIQHFSREECIQYLQHHDWEGDFHNGDETREFVEKALLILEQLPNRYVE